MTHFISHQRSGQCHGLHPELGLSANRCSPWSISQGDWEWYLFWWKRDVLMWPEGKTRLICNFKIKSCGLFPPSWDIRSAWSANSKCVIFFGNWTKEPHQRCSLYWIAVPIFKHSFLKQFCLNCIENNRKLNRKLCCNFVLQVCAVLKNGVPGKHLSDKVTSLLPTSVPVRVSAHEVNYYGRLNTLVSWLSLNRGRRTTHTFRSGTESTAIPHSSVFLVMQVALLAALWKPRGKTQKRPSVIPILSWRGWSWGWSSWRR